MSSRRAFIPGPLAQAQPRVYKSFRARQVRGLCLAVVGAGISLFLFGASDVLGYAVCFLAAVPGFAYGYYQPDGKPIEYWLRIVVRYYWHSRVLTSSPLPGPCGRFWGRIQHLVRSIRRSRRMRILAKEKEARRRERAHHSVSA